MWVTGIVCAGIVVVAIKGFRPDTGTVRTHIDDRACVGIVAWLISRRVQTPQFSAGIGSARIGIITLKSHSRCADSLLAAISKRAWIPIIAKSLCI